VSKQKKVFHYAPLSTAFLLAILLGPSLASAQQGEGVPTQSLIAIDSKSPVIPTQVNTTIKVDNRTTPLVGISRVLPTGAQVALLIDDGLRTSVGRELGSLRTFVQSLPPGTEVFVGYMQNGRVVPAQGFTTNFAAAANALHLPTGLPGSSASPYFCLSDFVKHWPPETETASSNQMAPDQAGPARKARFVLMITNGVDPYNGSTSPMNQNSPYVESAIADSQRAGVPVYPIYFSDSGFRRGMSSFSGQSYLQQVADGTGGFAYYLGTGNPVSIAPFLTQFQRAVADTYVVTFDAPADKKLVRVKLSTNVKGAKLRSADQVQPGARFSAGQ
jgi:hypothetical protein